MKWLKQDGAVVKVDAWRGGDANTLEAVLLLWSILTRWEVGREPYPSTGCDGCVCIECMSYAMLC
jgi:hypothetical protein